MDVENLGEVSQLLDFENFSKYVSFESVSDKKERADELLKCASWLVGYLRTFCEEANIFETINKPVVVAKCCGSSASKPQVGIYGHYDVQPVSPEEVWSTHPFELTHREGRLYARGASDNKGQFWYTIQALKTLKQQGALIRDVYIFVEGEEESDGLGTIRFLETEGRKIFDQVSAFLLVDSLAVSEKIETVCLGLRGVGWLEFEVLGSPLELHQGVHGGLAPNPVHEALRIWYLATRDDFKHLPNFWDGWAGAPSVEILSLVQDFADFQNLYYEELKISDWYKARFHPWLLGFYPTVDIVGVKGGYVDDGIKCSIPTKANLKISIRSAFNQKTSQIITSLKNFFQSNLQPGFRLEIVSEGASSDPLLLPFTHSQVNLAKSIIGSSTKNQVVYIWSGGSLPLAKTLWDMGIIPLIIGFGLPEDNIHAANESIKVSQMLKGFQTVKGLITDL